MGLGTLTQGAFSQTLSPLKIISFVKGVQKFGVFVFELNKKIDNTYTQLPVSLA